MRRDPCSNEGQGEGWGRALPRQGFAPSFPAHRDIVQE